MMKIWLKNVYYEKFFLGEFEEKFFNLRFSHYKNKKIGDNEVLVYVPLDVYMFYRKK